VNVAAACFEKVFRVIGGIDFLISSISSTNLSSIVGADDVEDECFGDQSVGAGFSIDFGCISILKKASMLDLSSVISILAGIFHKAESGGNEPACVDTRVMVENRVGSNRANS
jgi:hypothetical protein